MDQHIDSMLAGIASERAMIKAKLNVHGDSPNLRRRLWWLGVYRKFWKAFQMGFSANG